MLIEGFGLSIIFQKSTSIAMEVFSSTSFGLSHSSTIIPDTLLCVIDMSYYSSSLGDIKTIVGSV